MTDFVIETRGLRKAFRHGAQRVVAVDGLDLAVPAGGVHGFLGPNGAGKSTTLGLLLGLISPSSGEASLFGQRVPARLPQVIDRVGAVIEGPAFVPTFSGRKNLQLLARTIEAPSGQVDKVLEQVNLAGVARRRYRAYSLGNRQRLAIAAGLLKSPDLLILDEPTNGLDPAGVRDVRELIAELGRSGVTVLLSSHVLAEVQQLCRSVSIIANGKLLASGPVDELLGEKVSQTRVGVADPEKAAGHLEAAGYEAHRDADDLIVRGHEHPEHISRLLAEHDIYVHELSAIRPDLEEFFLELTGSAEVDR